MTDAATDPCDCTDWYCSANGCVRRRLAAEQSLRKENEELRRQNQQLWSIVNYYRIGMASAGYMRRAPSARPWNWRLDDQEPLDVATEASPNG
jgi:hypothetical protein